MLVRYFIARTRDRTLAEDIVQDLYVRISQLDADYLPDNPTAFLFQSARNIWLNHIRSQTRGSRREGEWQDLHTVRVNSEAVADAPSLEDELTGRQQLNALSKALMELPEKTQTIFRLHKIDGIRQADVATQLGISKSSVDKHVCAAVRHLMQRLKPPLGP